MCSTPTKKGVEDGTAAVPAPLEVPAAGAGNAGLPHHPTDPAFETFEEAKDELSVTDDVTDEELLSEMDVVGVTQLMVEHLTRNLKLFYGKNFLEIFMNVTLLPIQLVFSAVLTPIFVAFRTVVSVIFLVCYGALKFGWAAGVVGRYLWRETDLDKLADGVALISINIFFRENGRPTSIKQ